MPTAKFSLTFNIFVLLRTKLNSVIHRLENIIKEKLRKTSFFLNSTFWCVAGFLWYLESRHPQFFLSHFLNLLIGCCYIDCDSLCRKLYFNKDNWEKEVLTFYLKSINLLLINTTTTTITTANSTKTKLSDPFLLTRFYCFLASKNWRN